MLPKMIVSDRYPKLTCAFWKHSLKKCETKLRFATAFHIQTDGEAERVNEIFDQHLRNLVSADQQDWANYVGRADFSYNVVTHLVK